MEALKEVVTHVLDQQGVLAKLKAELRANVFLALQEHGQEEKTVGFDKQFMNPCRQKLLESKEGQMLFSLVREFLECAGMTYTLKVFEPELNMNKMQSRKSLADELRVPASELQKGMPLLYTFIKEVYSDPEEKNLINENFIQNQNNSVDIATSPIPAKRRAFDGHSNTQSDEGGQESKQGGILRKLSSGSTFSESDLDELETDSLLEMPSQQLNVENDHISKDGLQKEESQLFIGGQNQQEEEDDDDDDVDQDLFQVHRFNKFEEEQGIGSIYLDQQLGEENLKDQGFEEQLAIQQNVNEPNYDTEQKIEQTIDEFTPAKPTRLGPLPSIGGVSKLGNLPPLSLGGSKGKLEVAAQDLKEELKQQGLISLKIDQDENMDAFSDDNNGGEYELDDVSIEEDIDEDIEEEDSNLSFGFETAEAVTPLGQQKSQFQDGLDGIEGDE